MKLELSQSLQQQQILAPQMILSMDILLLPSLDLEQRVREEFAENPALEIVERHGEPRRKEDRPNDTLGQADFSRVESFSSFSDLPRRKTSVLDRDTKYEALQNTEGRPPGLREQLVQQIHLRNLREDVRDTAEEIVSNLDQRGYLLAPPDELRSSTEDSEIFDEALRVVRSLDPAGVGAENLQDCLLLQLERDQQEYPLERKIISEHLLDLGLNKLPKIAKEIGATLEDVKDALEIISSLDPIPGGRVEPQQTIYVRPDVWVEVVDGEITVRVENGNLPELTISDSCRGLLQKSRGNREVADFVRKKVESAQWLIQAIEQRQRTLEEISYALVDYQREFMLRGPSHVRALKMQTIADIVGVHLSTISRAIKGKYIQTPYGLFEMRYFFTGGVENEEGELESRRNIYLRIQDIIDKEDKRRPLSDTKVAEALQREGLQIARRTVTKYREQKGIPASRLRRQY